MLRALVVLLLLVILVPTAVVLALRSRAVRGVIFDRVAAAIEATAGLKITARDFSLHLPTGVLEVDRLSVCLPGSESRPFLVVQRARATVGWHTLLGQRLRLDSLTLDQPRLDLAAPRPRGPADRSPSGSTGLDILNIDVVGGTIRSDEVPSRLEVWLDAWRAEAIVVRGNYVSGLLDLAVTGQVRAESRRRDPVTAAVNASLSVTDSGRLELRSIELRGEAVTLQAEAKGELTPIRPDALAFALTADAGRLFPDLTAGGRLESSGELQRVESTLEGSLRVDAESFPAELVSPLIGTVKLEALGLEGTVIDVAADLGVALPLETETAKPGGSFEGVAGLVWRRDRERLLEASVRAPEDSALDDARGVRLLIEADLFPDAIGSRRLTGELRAPGWLELAAGELREARLQVDEPDLAAAVERMGLFGQDETSWRPVGSLKGAVEASGPLRMLEMRLDADWQVGAERLVQLSARSVTRAEVDAEHPLDVAFEAAFLPDAAGRLEAEGGLVAGSWMTLAEGELRGTRLDLALPDLRATAPRIDSLLEELRATGIAPEWAAWAERMEGSLEGEVLVSGRPSDAEIELRAVWHPQADEFVELHARGKALATDPWLDGPIDARLSFENLDVARFTAVRPPPADDVDARSDGERPQLGGRISGSLLLAGRPDELSTRLQADGVGLRYADYPAIERLTLKARGTGPVIELELSGNLEQRYTGQGESRFEGQGRFRLDRRLREAELRIAMHALAQGVDSIEAALRLAGGTLHVDSLEIDSAGRVARLSGMIPLGLTGLGSTLAGWPLDPDEGTASITVNDLRLGPLLAMLEPEGQEDAPRWEATIDGSVFVDRLEIGAAKGTLEVSGIAVEIGEERYEAEQSARLDLGGGRLVLSPTRLVASGESAAGRAPLELVGFVELARDWQPEEGFAALVEQLSLEARGSVDVALFNPFLAGGVASGRGRLDARLEGTPGALTAHLNLDGDEATLFYASPYPSKFERPHVTLTVREGRAVLERARAEYNGGSCELQGTYTPGEGLELGMRFDSVRYRLDYGAVAIVGGSLQLDWPLEGRRRLGGEIVVERAVLRRDINLDREVLRALFDPDPGSTTHRLLDTIDLDLELSTDEGLQVKNNLADLRAEWGILRVGGTLANPLVTGQVEVSPGGRLQLIGQTLRIDEGSLTWSGEPPGEPRLLMETTSSLEDPTIRQDWQSSAWGSGPILGAGRGGSLDLNRQQDTSAEAWQAFTAGLLAHYQGQLVSGLQSTELSFEPLPLFGETDTQARYTLAQQLSPNATFIASRNPREAESQTYILDLHNFYFSPRMRAQIFTNDQKNEGLTLQQTVRLGGRRESDEGPRVRSRRVDVPEGVPRRKIRRALGYRKGDPFPPGARLDVEVDVAEAMRRFGYPDSTVEVSTEPASKRRVDLSVFVEAGSPVDFVYEGEKLSRSLRRAIAERYRADDESESVRGLREETIRVLHGLGYLSPRVDVTIEPAGAERPRTVRVVSDGGRRVAPGPPVFLGVSADEAEQLRQQFMSRLARVELAAGEPAADRHVVEYLRALGYPDAEIVSRELSDDGKRLSVRLEPGRRQQIASLEIVGVEADLAERLRQLIELDVGDPAGSGSLAGAAHAIEDDLRQRGYAEARVRTLAQPRLLDRPFDMTVRIEIETGPVHRIGSIRYEGLRASRPRWVERIAGIEEGQDFSRHRIGEARGSLYRTGVFQRIRVSSDQRPADREGEGNGRVGAVSTPEPSGPLITDVTFQLEEAPRYLVSYGGRWENGRGLGIVVDALDRNSLGRGHTSGVRVVYGADRKSLRLYHVIPRVVGPRGTLELFVESKEEVIENITDKGVESWVQLTFPLTERVQNRLYTVFQTRELTQDPPDPNEPLDDRVISPRLGWQVAYDTQSRTVGQPRRNGLFLGVDVSGSHKQLGSDLTVLALFTQLKLFLPIGKSESGRFTWSQSWRTGLVDGFGDEIPVVDRLRAGGEFSVRGYRTDSLGPQDAEGNALGGEFLFVVNQELHSRIWGSISGLAFFDAGNVWETKEQADLDLFKSVGLGARYLSPVGPLRLDLAWPLDEKEGDPEYKVYFGFGNVF